MHAKSNSKIGEIYLLACSKYQVRLYLLFIIKLLIYPEKEWQQKERQIL